MSLRPDIPLLLVEDDPNDQLLFKRALAKANIANDIRVIGDGDTAVAYLAGEGAYGDRELHPLPALMFLDLKLPRRSGLEVLHWVRAQRLLGRLPVIVLTSSQQREDIDRAYDLRANSYLLKPVDLPTLTQLIQRAGVYWTGLNVPPVIA